MGHGTRRPAAQDGRRRWYGVVCGLVGLVVSYDSVLVRREGWLVCRV